MEKYFKNKEDYKRYIQEAETMQSYFTKEEKIILHKGYSTAFRLRQVLLNMFNSDIFKEVDLLGIRLNSDEKHKALFSKIYNMEVSYINHDLFDEFSELIKYETKLLNI